MDKFILIHTKIFGVLKWNENKKKAKNVIKKKKTHSGVSVLRIEEGDQQEIIYHLIY